MSSPHLPHLNCRLAGTCSGCAWIERPYESQATDKVMLLRELWMKAGIPHALPDPRFVAIASGGLRDRADLMIDSRGADGYRFGLFSTAERSIVDISVCPQFSTRLNELLARFREIPFPIDRGSVRLRVSPSGEFGVWLDLANIDVKQLLEERTTLDRLRAIAFVEIGQKRKALVERDGQLKLADAVLKPWFETYLGESAKPAAVWTTVGGFTQPGFAANRVLVTEARATWMDLVGGRAAEFGSGHGNFTLALAGDGFEVEAYEIDSLACEGLRKGAQASGLDNKIRVHEGDFQRTSNRAELNGVDILFVDPPRSGLKAFIDPLATISKLDRPKNVVYVSCFAESFCADAKRLTELGYQATRMTLVDQFPQSPHFEIVARFDLMT